MVLCFLSLFEHGAPVKKFQRSNARNEWLGSAIVNKVTECSDIRTQSATYIFWFRRRMLEQMLPVPVPVLPETRTLECC